MSTVIIGRYEFSEKSRENLVKLCELMNMDTEKYVAEGQKYIFSLSLLELLKMLPEEKRKELGSKIADPELFQSMFRMSFEEQVIKTVFVKYHNQFINELIERTTGSYSDEVMKQVETLRL